MGIPGDFQGFLLGHFEKWEFPKEFPHCIAMALAWEFPEAGIPMGITEYFSFFLGVIRLAIFLGASPEIEKSNPNCEPGKSPRRAEVRQAPRLVRS